MSKVDSERQCHLCGVYLSRYNLADLCWSCQESRKASIEAVPKVSSRAFQPLTQSSRKTLITQSILNIVRRTEPFCTSDVGQFLKGYRSAHGLTQSQLAAVLGFDQSYISKLENGQDLRKVTSLKEIATRLAIPPHLLVGVTLEGYTTKYSTELLEVAPSVIHLSRIVREAGRADEAVNELWPVFLRLEAQATQDKDNISLLLTLSAGQTALGVILGDLLPEEDLYVTAHYLKKAASIADEFGDNTLKAEIYRGCGNELRKHKQFSEALYYLEGALFFASDNLTRGLATLLLARAYGEMGDQDHFDEKIEEALPLLDKAAYFTATFNPIMIHEVHLRGLLNLRRFDKISSTLEKNNKSNMVFHIAPQWRVISHLTTAEAMFRIGSIDDGLAEIQSALVGAEVCKLPHQVQRAIRSLKLVESYDSAKQIFSQAHTLLTKLAPRPS